ncbi:hypothetical protein U1Q18_026117 [Sarracenia purpurea var. burkii]
MALVCGLLVCWLVFFGSVALALGPSFWFGYFVLFGFGFVAAMCQSWCLGVLPFPWSVVDMLALGFAGLVYLALPLWFCSFPLWSTWPL